MNVRKNENLILWLGIFAYLSLGIFQAFFVPIENDRGAFSDESIHVAASLDYANWISAGFGLAPIDVSQNEVDAYLAGRLSEWRAVEKVSGKSFFSVFSSTGWQLVYVFYGVFQVVLPASLGLEARIIGARLLTLGASLLFWPVLLSLVQLLELRRRSTAILICTVVLLTPSVPRMMTTVATDSVAMIVASVLLLLFAKCLTYRASQTEWILLLLGVFACFYIKETLFLLIIAIFSFLMLSRLGWLKWRQWVIFGAAILLIAVGTGRLLQQRYIEPGIANWLWPTSRYLFNTVQIPSPSEYSDERFPSAFVITEEFAPLRKLYPQFQQLALFGTQQPLQYVDIAVPDAENQYLLLGGWFRADEPLEVDLPSLIDMTGKVYRSDSVELNEDWTFYIASIPIGNDFPDGIVQVQLQKANERPIYAGEIFFSVSQTDLSLTTNSREDVETFIAKQPNFLLNADFSGNWPIYTGPYGYFLNRQTYALLNFERTWPAYVAGVRAIMSTFWASIGADVPGLKSIWVLGFASLTLIGLLAWGWLNRTRNAANTKLIVNTLWLIVGAYVMFAIITMTITPQHFSPLYYAPSRRIYPLLVVCMLLAHVGIQHILRSVKLQNIFIAGALAFAFAANIVQITNREAIVFTCDAYTAVECVLDW